MAVSREEFEKEASEKATEAFEKFAEDQKADALAAREEQPDQTETEEEYYWRIANVPGIFGDLDTSIEIPVVSRNNEAASVAVAEKDAAVAEGELEEGEVSDDEARRQPDVAAEGQPDAEEVEEGAEDHDDEEHVVVDDDHELVVEDDHKDDEVV